MFSCIKPEKLKPSILSYVLTSHLGTGGFGTVLLGIHKVSGKSVAVKVTGTKRGNVYEEYDIKKTYRAVKALKHPHIVEQYNTALNSRYVIHIMDFASRLNLLTYTPESERDVQRIFQQLISAVYYCHRKGLTHRDIKLENILLDDRYNIMLADFDLSAVMEDGKFFITRCGTKAYNAPEIDAKGAHDGEQLDIFTCGVCLAILTVKQVCEEKKIKPKDADSNIISFHLKPAHADLIINMQRQNYRKRYTMYDVRNNTWFEEKLPDYLLPSWQYRSPYINKVILEEVCKKTGVSRGLAYYAIKKGDLSNNICLQYCLAVDNWVVDKKRAACLVPPAYEKPVVTGLENLIFCHGFSYVDIMCSVYLALLYVGLEWKVVDRYHYIIRRRGYWPTEIKMELKFYTTLKYTARYVIRIRSLPQEHETDSISHESSHKVTSFLEECGIFVSVFREYLKEFKEGSYKDPNAYWLLKAHWRLEQLT